MTRVSEHSPLLKQLQKDPKTAKAVKNCKELFNDASDDFRRSVDQVGAFDLSNIDKILSNLKVWLSATVTYQETCLDGFQNNTAAAGMKVRRLLNTSMQLSSNGIAIVTGMSDAVGDLQLNGLSSRSRRLLTWSDDFVAGHNEFVDEEFIEKMSRQTEVKGKSMISKVKPDDMIPRWLDLDDRRRKLLQAKTLNDLKPNVVVAQDGTGKYKKIGDSFTEIPKNGKEPFVIFVKEGVYKEHLRLEKWQTNVVLVGAGPTKTRLSGNLNFIDGVPTFQTCTLAVCGDHFIAKDIGIENTAGPEKHQAVALRVQSDQSIFYNCHFDGYQDTLYTHTYRQYYRDCQISGTIDFIFGDAAAFFQNCTFVVRKPLDNQACIVTAQGRKERHQPTGIIIHKSKIVADPDYFPVRFKNKAYLGRPWKEFSKTLVMESDIDDLIQPDGWMPWEGEFGLRTCYYGEYRNEGPGANMEHRVKWPGIKTIKPSRAEKFMPPILYEGDDWIKASGVPYIPALLSDPSDFALPPGSHGHDEDPNQKPVILKNKSKSKDKKSKDKYKAPSSKSKSKDKSKKSSDDSSKKSKSKSSNDSKSKSSKNSKDSSSKHVAPSPSPSSERTLIQKESNPSLMNKIKKMLIQTTKDTGSPTLFYNLEKKLAQGNGRRLDDVGFVDARKLDDKNDDDDDDSDDDDDHDTVVTPVDAKVDKFLETIHLKKRSDLESPSPSPSPVERKLMEHVEQKAGEAEANAAANNAANNPDMAKLAASPQAKALQGKNASELAKAPGANDLLQQFGLSSSSLQGPPGAQAKAEGEAKKASAAHARGARVYTTAVAVALVLVGLVV